MQILEAALAFAITMLVLSLICSSFVEIIHRVFSTRENGLKYLLGQMFDQVLSRYVERYRQAHPDSPLVANGLAALRTDFIARMSANRAPNEVTPNATPTKDAAPRSRFEVSLWSGRDLTSLEPTEFMERLGTLNLGEIVKQANDTANNAANAVADAADAVLKDIAQKFEAFGKEAGAYFAGRARLLSVTVAILLAFAIRVDAIELFNTYLRDPNARNKVIEQSQAATAQYKAATDAANALRQAGGAVDPDAKKQVEDLQKDLKAAIDNARGTTKQYADLGLPIGWTKENATLDPNARTCSKDGVLRLVGDKEQCKSGEQEGTVGWWTVIKLACSLLLGGLLIGLGGPFWYDTVVGLSNIRSIARELTGGSAKPDAQAGPAAQPVQPVAPAGPANPDRPQPATPVGTFTTARAAQVASAPVAQPQVQQQAVQQAVAAQAVGA